MKPFELIEVELDKKRSLLMNHEALFRAETQINKLRHSRPDEHAAIDTLMIDAYNRILRKTGLLPLDLLFVLLWASLLHEDPGLRLEQIPSLIDRSPLSRVELSERLWQAYFKSAGKNLVEVKNDEEPEKKTELPPGSSNGALPDTSSIV